jgi:hypothetical protein
MQITLKNGKNVRGVNGGRGLERAVFDFNSGELGDPQDPLHLHVYLSGRAEIFAFLCSGSPLSVDEQLEAEDALAARKTQEEYKRSA